jgi:hypothetical protein
MNYNFNKNEMNKILDFIKTHNKCKKIFKKNFSINYFNNGIGTQIIIKCNNCNKSKDVSDYDNW